jgi:antitoxin ChpS
MLTSTLRTVGGSVMMTIPKAVLDVLGLGVNDKVVLHVDAGRLLVEPRPRPKYALAELLAQCDASAEPSQDEPSQELRAWDATEPVGREAI